LLPAEKGYLAKRPQQTVDETKQKQATTTHHVRNAAATGGGLDGALVDGAGGGDIWLMGRVWFRVGQGLIRGDLTSFFYPKPN
jgi:hypothetical protein